MTTHIESEAEYWKACRDAWRNYRSLARMGAETVKLETMRDFVQRAVSALGGQEAAIDQFEKRRSYLDRKGRLPLDSKAPMPRHHGPSPFQGIFVDLESMLTEFEITERDIEGYTVLLAWGEEAGFYGACKSYVLLRSQKYGTLYEVRGSHYSCFSCFKFAGQWQLDSVSLPDLESRILEDMGVSYQEREALRGVVAALRLEEVPETSHMLLPVAMERIPSSEEDALHDANQIPPLAAEIVSEIDARRVEGAGK